MDWANERYVRIYTRDTAFLIAIGHTARGLLWDIMRKADRAGVIQLDGMAPEKVVAAVTGYPIDVVEECLPLLTNGDGAPVMVTTNAIVVRNYIEANETASTNAQRCRAKRERARAFSQLDSEAQNLRATRNVSEVTRDGGPTTQNVSRATQNVSKVTRDDRVTTTIDRVTTTIDPVTTTRTVPCRAVPSVPPADAGVARAQAPACESGEPGFDAGGSDSTSSSAPGQSRQGVYELPWDVFWDDLRGRTPKNGTRLTKPLEPTRDVVDRVLEQGGDQAALDEIRATCVDFAELIGANPTIAFVEGGSMAVQQWQLSMFRPRAWAQVCRLVTRYRAERDAPTTAGPIRYDGRGNVIGAEA